MKKTAIFSMLFLFTMGMTAGIVVGLSDTAQAIGQCSGPCLSKTTCSLDTGPACTNPSQPYYVYVESTCTGGPLNCPWVHKQQCDCWNGVDPCRIRCLVF